MVLAVHVAHSDRPSQLQMTDEFLFRRDLVSATKFPVARNKHTALIPMGAQDNARFFAPINPVRKHFPTSVPSRDHLRLSN
jgi:hypothetical protein